MSSAPHAALPSTLVPTPHSSRPRCRLGRLRLHDDAARGSFNGKASVPVTPTCIPSFDRCRRAYRPCPWRWRTAERLLEPYPYSCTEQLVSVAMPAIVLATAGVRRLQAHEGASLATLIDELRARQTVTGRSVLAGGVESYDYVSVYALHVLMEAATAAMRSHRSARRRKGFLTQLARRDVIQCQMSARRPMRSICSPARASCSERGCRIAARLSTRYEKVWRETSPRRISRCVQADAARRLGNQAIAACLRASADVDRWHEPMATDSMLLYLLSLHFPERLAHLPDGVLETWWLA